MPPSTNCVQKPLFPQLQHHHPSPRPRPASAAAPPTSPPKLAPSSAADSVVGSFAASKAFPLTREVYTTNMNVYASAFL
jgi:hypothetical protein